MSPSTSSSIASTSSSPAASLKILTLNIWGLAYISKARQFRIHHIADRIVNGDWDVVCLQECWVESQDWRDIKRRVSGKLPHAKFFLSGSFGSGLGVLSKFPIVGASTHPYILNGHPLDVGAGDWFVGKAAGVVTLDVGGGMLVDVWNTHTCAIGGDDGPETKRAHRIAQAWHLSKLVQTSAERGRHVLAVGDFNSIPPALPIAILRNLAQLSDAYLSTHPNLPENATSLPGSQSFNHTSAGIQRAISELGVTADSPLNSWSAGKRLDFYARAAAGKRLDYIFYRAPASTNHAQRVPLKSRLTPRSCEVCFTEKIPGTEMSYSDHFGLEATFDVSSDVETFATSDKAADAFARKKLAATLTSCLAALGAYRHQALKGQKNHLMGFAASVTAALGLIVTTPFAGYRGYSFWSAIATLLAVVAGWAGTTMLYSGLIWGEWEQRSLRTVIDSMEMELTQIAAADEQGEDALPVPITGTQEPGSGGVEANGDPRTVETLI